MDISWMEAHELYPPKASRGRAAVVGSRVLLRGAPVLAGLVFEMNGILCDDSAWQRWLLQVLSRMGLHTQYGPFFRVFHREYLPEVYAGKRDFWDAMRDYLTSAGLSRGQIAELEIAARAKRRQCDEDFRPMPGVASILANLSSRGIRLAIVSNATCSTAELEARLRKMGIADRFRTVVSSRDLGYAKPASQAYSRAMDQVGLGPAQLAYVGRDSVDLHGAQIAGLVTIALHYEVQAPADVYLERFEDLLTAVHYADRSGPPQLNSTQSSNPA